MVERDHKADPKTNRIKIRSHKAVTPSKTTNTVMPPPGSFHIEYGIKFIILLNRHIFVQFFLSSEKNEGKKKFLFE
jgi:hypothetical protein